MGRSRRAGVAALVSEATIDAYDDSEQLLGLYTMLEDNLVVPFDTMILGVPVTVVAVVQTRAGRVVADCRHGDHQQNIDLLELPLPDPEPQGAEWIDAYRYWAEQSC